MHNAEINPQIFSETVSEYFDFLVSEYGYVMHPQSPDHFMAEKDDIRMHIALDRGINPEVYVEFLGPAAQQVGKSNRVDVVLIVEGLYPGVDSKMEFSKKRTDIAGMRKKLEKYATLTKKYLSQILEGDLTRWPEVEAYLDERNRKWRERLDKITKK